jgi:NADPH:quinone reductase-like Zn-dependent oxidoreductase
MRAVVFERFGEPREVLGMQERPLPEPNPGQVRLQLVQSPIHNHDLAIVRGVYGYKPTLPAVVGTEGLGVVDKLGPAVTHLTVGQRVCAMGQGTWAEYFLANAATAVPVPPSLSDERACQLLAMPLSAYLLLEDLDLKPGDWMIQNAANGAVGRLVHRLARKREVNVVNLVRRQETATALEAEGMGPALATDDPTWPTRLSQVTGGAPVRRGVDSVGGKAANQMLAAMAPGSLLLSFGAMSGQALVVDPGHLIFRGATVKGFWATSRSERTPATDRARIIGELVRLVAAGELPLQVAATFDLSRPAEAVAASETPGRSGKVTFASRP